MNNDVERINATLREQRLGWIADEIEMTIARGKPITKDSPRGKPKETMVVPLSPEEEEEVLIRVLRNYLVEVEDIWRSAEATFAEEVSEHGNAPIALSITEAASDRSVPLFDVETEMPRRKLDELLRQAWPGGPEDYPRRVIEQRRD
ncbi:MAG: hypothetical protein QOJ45_1165 [Verrucomicrobiota bacterium]|jgi:hypothetical protein